MPRSILYLVKYRHVRIIYLNTPLYVVSILSTPRRRYVIKAIYIFIPRVLLTPTIIKITILRTSPIEFREPLSKT